MSLYGWFRVTVVVALSVPVGVFLGVLLTALLAV